MIISQVKTVTPKMAREWLKNHNNSNRNLNLNRAKFYRDIILQGKWETTHQGIAFFENGELADGQHRLKGIDLANIAVEVLVTQGLKREGALAIDNGRVRSTHDQLKIAGIGGLTNTGAAILRILATKGNSETPNIYKLEEYFTRHTDMVLLGQELAKGNVKKITSAPICAALAVCSLYVNEDDVKRFMEVLKTGIPPEPIRNVDFTVVRYRNHLIQSTHNQNGSEPRRALMKKTMRVFKAYIEGQELSKFLEQSDFIYPIPD